MHVPMWACAWDCRYPWRPEVSEPLELELQAATTIQYIQSSSWAAYFLNTWVISPAPMQGSILYFFPLFLYVYVCACVLEAVHMRECRHIVQRQMFGGQHTIVGRQSSPSTSFDTRSLQCFLIQAGSWRALGDSWLTFHFLEGLHCGYRHMNYCTQLFRWLWRIWTQVLLPREPSPQLHVLYFHVSKIHTHCKVCHKEHADVLQISMYRFLNAS